MMCSYCKGDGAEMPHRLCPSCLGRFTGGVPESALTLRQQAVDELRAVTKAHGVRFPPAEEMRDD